MGGGEKGNDITSWSPTPSSHSTLQPTESIDSDVFSTGAPLDILNPEQRRSRSPHSNTPSVASAESHTAAVLKDIAGSLDSKGSAVGSYTSDGSPVHMAQGQTPSVSSAGSATKKPPPPPKPKSLERGVQSKRDKQMVKSMSDEERPQSSKGFAPPPKPPRLRESTKKTSENEEGVSSAQDKVEDAIPPPKPSRKYRTLKREKPDNSSILEQRKTQTLQMPKNRKPIPSPKPPSLSNQGPNVATCVDRPSPLSLEESVANKLTEEGIDLTIDSYTDIVSISLCI